MAESMECVRLKNSTSSSDSLEAVFCPAKGMNLMSFKRGNIEAIDQATMPLFEERNAGLGALIGPHFHERESVPEDFDTTLFPHIAEMRAKGRRDFFSHGLARYAVWRETHSITQIEAELCGDDLLQGIPLKKLEGFDFKMKYSAKLVPDGLLIRYSVKSEKPSVIGFHYYYHIEGKTTVRAEVQGEKRHLDYEIDEDIDKNFRAIQSENTPFNRICLHTGGYILHIDHVANYDDESSWQLYHPKGASYACIEPLTAINPRKPVFNETEIELKLSIHN